MKKIYFILSVLSLFVASCQQPEKVDSLSDSQQAKEVKPDVALKVARNFDIFFSISTKNGSKNARISKEKTVKKMTPFKDENGNVLYYIINYNEGGFAIVSAEKKIMPILAFSETNDFPTDKEFPKGVKDMLNIYDQSIKKVRLSDFKPDSAVIREWERLGNTIAINELVEKGRNEGARTTDKPVDPPCEDTHIYVGPFLTTNWGQSCGYNGQMPLESSIPALTGCGNPCSRALTGCVATAMAQVMNFHHFPSSYNWSAMGANQAETFRLMRNAANSVNMQYVCGGSSAFPSDIPNALYSSFGYSSGISHLNFNNSILQSEILNFGRPVILSGWNSAMQNGHTWVCDGFYQVISCTSTYAPLYHMNWGWYGDFNGLYSISDLTPDAWNFSTSVKMDVYIKP